MMDMKLIGVPFALSLATLTACSETSGKPDLNADTVKQVAATQPASLADLRERFPEPLQDEVVGTTLELDVPYPDSYAFIHDGSFFNMIDGRFILMDLAAPNKAYKANVHGGNVGSLAVSPEREEFYISTTYFSRGVTGERTDIVAIHDMRDFSKIDEIILPPRRASTMPYKHKFALAGNGKIGFIFNFTPAASVSVVDLDSRKVVNEIPIPGCSLHYPMGETSFATICGDGSMLGVNVDSNGQLLGESRSEPFLDYSDDAGFMKVAQLGDLTYIPTFMGNMHVVDLSKETPTLKNTFSLVSDAERADNWRPGGWQLIADNGDDLIYVLMHKDGREGSHKDGGTDVWVYKASTQKRVQKIKLDNHAISLAAVGSRLVATTGEMTLDVYDLASGDFQRQIGGAAQTPFLVYDAAGK